MATKPRKDSASLPMDANLALPDGCSEDDTSNDLPADELAATLGAAAEDHTNGAVPQLPQGMSFMQMLLGDWDGFDMASKLLDINVQVAAPARASLGSKWGANMPGAMNIDQVLQKLDA